MRSPLLVCMLALAACSSESAGPSIAMDFGQPSAYAAPFPGDHLLGADGTADIGGFPHPPGFPIVDAVIGLLDGRARGFGSTSGVFFRLDAAPDPASLPDLHGSVQHDSAVVWLDADESSPEYLTRIPVTVRFEPEAGLFGAPNLLGVLPLQGRVLRPRTLYAVAITRRLTTAGAAFAPAPALAAIASGAPVPGLGEAAADSYRRAHRALGAAGIAADEIVALAALTTDEPTSELDRLAADARGLPTPAPLAAWTQTDVFDDYCVYQSELEMPVYQRGEPPYSEAGGDIVFTGGVPQLDHHERARIVVTVPRSAMPAGGWPTAVMIRTGGGGDRPLVDRGPRAEPGGDALEPGSGPARIFARAGFAGVSVDGPHGGIRNVSGGDEQLLIFNFTNPVAMRDNLRQSAIELALVPEVLAPLALDVSDCPDAGTEARFATEELALMGHSMGATIAPLVLAVEPRFRAVVLSGAGGSWIENVIHKQSPVPIKPLAQVLIGYPARGLSLTEHDPFLNLLQWAGESADPPVYARRVAEFDPRHVLMIQGIVDTYILPPIANATSLSFGLDLGGPALDADHPELGAFRPLGELLEYGGGRHVELPAGGDGHVALVVQHAEDGIEDGHEVMFQKEAPHHQVRCFLETWRAGAPVVIEGRGAFDPCP